MRWELKLNLCLEGQNKRIYLYRPVVTEINQPECQINVHGLDKLMCQIWHKG